MDEYITEELSPFDKGKNDELIEIVKRMKDCKDIMAFSQVDKRSNLLIKDNIRYILNIFIQSLPDVKKIYWQEQMAIMNDKTKTNDQIYQRFVNTCFYSKILDSRRYRIDGDPEKYINQNTPFPEVKAYVDKYNYAKNILKYNDNKSDHIAWWEKERSVDDLKAIYDVYLRYKDTPKEFPLSDTQTFVERTIEENAGRRARSYEEHFARTLADFIEIHDAINYTDISPSNTAVYTFALMDMEPFHFILNVKDPLLRKRIVNRVINLYNTMVDTDVEKANTFIKKFIEEPSRYSKLLSKDDTDEELIPWLGGKGNKRTRRTRKGKSIKRKSQKKKSRKRRSMKRSSKRK
jgi:hypothetical protein